MKKILIITLATALFSSCRVLSKYNREKVAGEINAEHIYGDAQSGDSLGLGDLSWREIFTDPTLQSLIERALQQNVNVRNAELHLKEINYALKATKHAFIPTVSISANGSINRPYDPYERLEFSNSKTYGVTANVGWQNVNFMQLINQKRGAEMKLKLMQATQQQVQSMIVANVAKMYYSLLQLDEQKILMQQTRDNWATYLDMTRKLMQAGQGNQANVSSIEAVYYTISQSLVTIDHNIHILENNLSTLLGESAQRIERSSLSAYHAPSMLTTGAPLSILSRRPDVKIAEMQLASAYYDRNAALSAFYPSLTLSASGGFTNSLGQSILNPGVMIGNAVAGLAQPIFTGGKLRAQYKIAETEVEIYKNDFIQSVVAAGNEVNTAMATLHNEESLRALIEGEARAQQTAYEATLKLYQHTPTNYLNVINAHNSMIEARMHQISNRVASINATIELYLALGGGTK